MIPSIECVGSTVFVDPEPHPADRTAVCPACGQTVPIGGWPARYLVHREPPPDLMAALEQSLEDAKAKIAAREAKDSYTAAFHGLGVL